MNVNRTNSQQNFTSTLIPYSSKKLVHTYLEPLNQYFIVVKCRYKRQND